MKVYQGGPEEGDHVVGVHQGAMAKPGASKIHDQTMGHRLLDHKM
jgi:hypothetical protein